ncbi:hypothetical protein [Hymenobacter sp.]|jgi:hypothetical protein|uniref:hypothetical protein n=1 Tax=Hymenobacter sp. TaxID=1898978 RepID=UPI002EDAA63D
MKNHLRPFYLALLLVSTTFCSKDPQAPNPIGTMGTNSGIALNNPGYPVGFNPQTCNTDTAGTYNFLEVEARNKSNVSDADFSTLRSAIEPALSDKFYQYGSYEPTFASEINQFSDDTKQFLQMYDDFLYSCYVAGRPETERPDYISDRLNSNFEGLAYNVANASYYSQEQKEQFAAAVEAARPLNQRALEVYTSLLSCESPYYRSSATKSPAKDVTGLGKKMLTLTFKEYEQLRNSGRIKAPIRDDTAYKSSFWKKLSKAAHKGFSMWLYTISGAIGGALQGAPYSVATGGASVAAGAFIGGFIGYAKGLQEVKANRCIFGPC